MRSWKGYFSFVKRFSDKFSYGNIPLESVLWDLKLRFGCVLFRYRRPYPGWSFYVKVYNYRSRGFNTLTVGYNLWLPVVLLHPNWVGARHGMWWRSPSCDWLPFDVFPSPFCLPHSSLGNLHWNSYIRPSCSCQWCFSWHWTDFAVRRSHWLQGCAIRDGSPAKELSACTLSDKNGNISTVNNN